jgi:hypothetical protein
MHIVARGGHSIGGKRDGSRREIPRDSVRTACQRLLRAFYNKRDVQMRSTLVSTLPLRRVPILYSQFSS